MRRWLGTVALLAILGGLTFFTFVDRGGESPATVEKIRLFPVGDARAKAMVVRTPESEVRLERRYGREPAWWVVEPVVAPVRDRFSPTLDVWLKGAKAKDKIGEGRDEAGNYGLDPASITVEVELEDGREVSLLIGDQVPVNLLGGDLEINYYYVMRPGEQVIYNTDSGGVIEVLGKGPNAMRNDMPVSVTPEEIHAFSVSEGGGEPFLSARLQEGDGETSWIFTRPEGLINEAGEIEGWLKKLTALRTRDFVDANDGAAMERYGLSRPESRLTLFWKRPRSNDELKELTLLVGNLSEDGNIRYLKREDEQTIYAVKTSDWDLIYSLAQRMTLGL